MSSILRVSRHVVIPPIMQIRVMSPRTAAAAAGWWVVPGKTCVAAYQPKGAASYAASKTNLAQPGVYDATEGVAPTWAAATGWTFNGSTQYLRAPVFVEEAWTTLCQFSAFTDSADKTLFGFIRGGYMSNIMIRPCGSSGVEYWHGTVLRRAPKATTGNLGLAGKQPYRNGAADGAPSTTAWDGANGINEMYISAWNYGGTAIWHAACTIQAFAIYSDTLSGPEVATLAAAMAAL